MLCNVCENAAVVQPLFTSFLGGISINEPSNQSNDSLYQSLHQETTSSLLLLGTHCKKAVLALYLVIYLVTLLKS